MRNKAQTPIPAASLVEQRSVGDSARNRAAAHRPRVEARQTNRGHAGRKFAVNADLRQTRVVVGDVCAVDACPFDLDPATVEVVKVANELTRDIREIAAQGDVIESRYGNSGTRAATQVGTETRRVVDVVVDRLERHGDLGVHVGSETQTDRVDVLLVYNSVYGGFELQTHNRPVSRVDQLGCVERSATGAQGAVIAAVDIDAAAVQVDERGLSRTGGRAGLHEHLHERRPQAWNAVLVRCGDAVQPHPASISQPVRYICQKLSADCTIPTELDGEHGDLTKVEAPRGWAIDRDGVAVPAIAGHLECA